MSEPQHFESVEQLEDALSAPTPAVIETLRQFEGDLLVLGVGGKMGPSLARMAKRAFDGAGLKRRVIGVARFSTPEASAPLQRHGIETLTCDLLDPDQLDRLPDVPNVVYLAGMKFGATGQEALTWAVNCHLPGLVSRKFRRSRIVALSTGNLYGLVPVSSGGSTEADPPNPAGDYAMSCVGRERVFEHFSRTLGIPMAMIRLNYAVELRYGVLVDIGRKVLAGEPVDVGIGYFNALWQAEAVAMTLQAFRHAAAPPFILNVTGPEILRTRTVAEQFGQRLGRRVRFTGTEAPDALLNNAQRAHGLMGRPQVLPDRMIAWIADWLARGGETLNKPTHFEVRDGKF